MLVLPDIDLEGALAAAEGLRLAISDTEVSVDGERIPITVSAGAAAWSGESAPALIERADSALYDAKEAGRNRVQASHVARAA
jgi:diguanylate cyclase